MQRYRNRISGPLLDRIDMHIEVPSVPIHIMQDDSANQEEDMSCQGLEDSTVSIPQLQTSNFKLQTF